MNHKDIESLESVFHDLNRRYVQKCAEFDMMKANHAIEMSKIKGDLTELISKLGPWVELINYMQIFMDSDDEDDRWIRNLYPEWVQERFSNHLYSLGFKEIKEKWGFK